MELTLSNMPPDVLRAIATILIADVGHAQYTMLRMCCKDIYIALPHYLYLVRKTHVLAYMHYKFSPDNCHLVRPLKYHLATHWCTNIGPTSGQKLVLARIDDVVAHMVREGRATRVYDLHEIKPPTGHSEGGTFDEVCRSNSTYRCPPSKGDFVRCRVTTEYTTTLVIGIVAGRYPLGIYRFVITNAALCNGEIVNATICSGEMTSTRALLGQLSAHCSWLSLGIHSRER